MESQRIKKATKNMDVPTDDQDTLAVVAQVFRANSQGNKTVTVELTADA
ncbi:MAG: hypothetical protein ABSB40_00125 [Nitrososphaeria archaeon]|jgi:hypothetical protein